MSDALLLLSGGIDSALCLYQRAAAGLPTRTHHVVLKDHEGRQDVEAKATRDVLDYMQRKFGTQIRHSESGMDFGRMWIPRNLHAWGYWAGVLLAAPANRHINELVVPSHIDSNLRKSLPMDQYIARVDRIYRSHIETICRRPITISHPLVAMTKADILAAIPKDLLALCWWCRRPQNGQVCHKCHTCRQVDRALQGV